MMQQIAEFVSVLSCALFTGAAVYINLVEHPARMQCGVELAATEFAPSYRRATVMQASCAGLGPLSSLAAWLAGASFWWLVAGVLLGSVIPFTLIVILPTNKRLLSLTLDKRSIEAERLGEAARGQERSEWIGFGIVSLLSDLQAACVTVDSASVFTCLSIAFRIKPENGAIRLQ